MSNQVARETLEARLSEMARKANALVEVINDLREQDGIPPLPPFGSGPGGGINADGAGATMTSIKPDSFYGKKLQTAVREYLEMRHAQAHGTNPATPKVIYDAICAGGYQFEAKTPDIAMVGLRALLRKRTQFFHKLPNGTYGLTVWYPDAKKPKASDVEDSDQDDAEQETETATTKKAAAAS